MHNRSPVSPHTPNTLQVALPEPTQDNIKPLFHGTPFSQEEKKQFLKSQISTISHEIKKQLDRMKKAIRKMKEER